MKRTAIPPRTLPLRSISHQPTTNTTAPTSTTPNPTTTTGATGATPGTFKFLRASSPSKIPTSTKTPDSTRSRRKTAHSSPPPSPKPIRRTVSERRIPTYSASSTQQQQTAGSSATFSRFSPRKTAQNGSAQNISTPKTPTSTEPVPKTPTFHEPVLKSQTSYEPHPKTPTTSNGLSRKTPSLNDLSLQTPILADPTPKPPTPKSSILKVPRTPIQEDDVRAQLIESSVPSSADIDPADIVPIFNNGSTLKHSPILIR